MSNTKLFTLRKVFPDHWSFMLGEIALRSFTVLMITGVFLPFWYDPSMAEVTYEGSYGPLRGVHMSAAYASTLDISFDVRCGLLVRQMHHWSAHIFIAAMMIHLLRHAWTAASASRATSYPLAVAADHLHLNLHATGDPDKPDVHIEQRLDPVLAHTIVRCTHSVQRRRRR